jgi:hypothetical protein
MANARTKKTAAEEAWEHYRSIQLTPEQKAVARAKVQERIDCARADGVYERMMELRGKVHLDLDLDELREDRD